MTAVVGILNKQAVALAADSAVTIDGASGKKIYNRALKIFTLSKHHPVGVMIFNSATFMAIPWETIIKAYRKQLGTTSFQTVKAYQENFIQFLHDKNFFTDEVFQKAYLGNLFQAVVNSLYNEAVKNPNPPLPAQEAAKNVRILALLEQQTDNWLVNLNANPNTYSEFANYSFADFTAFFDVTFASIIDGIFTPKGLNLSVGLRDKIKNAFYEFIKKWEVASTYTGLIFVGYGVDEIFPHLIPLNISFGIQTRLRYFIDDARAAHITHETHGAIRPFAQIDVISTILSGVDPHLENIFNTNVQATLTKFNQLLLNAIGNSNPALTAQLQALDLNVLVEEFKKKNNETKQSIYINPLMNAVSALSKEDLAEMAESLIYLTYLKRRMTNAEESVGGPVDVAIISKGDGFIWIKRKHYFRPELNQHFFDNYLNS